MSGIVLEFIFHYDSEAHANTITQNMASISLTHFSYSSNTYISYETSSQTKLKLTWLATKIAFVK